jgi:hypothetical protein
LKPESKHFEFAHHDSYVDEESGEYVYGDEFESPFEHVTTQAQLKNSYAYYSEAVDIMVVLRDKETDTLWGTLYYADSWHEEGWNVKPENIYEVEEKDVVIRQYVRK